MGDGSLIWLEVLLGFAVPFGWGVWQLIWLRRDRQRREAAEREVNRPGAAS
jgi:hypothetical protein